LVTRLLGEPRTLLLTLGERAVALHQRLLELRGTGFPFFDLLSSLLETLLATHQPSLQLLQLLSALARFLFPLGLRLQNQVLRPDFRFLPSDLRFGARFAEHARRRLVRVLLFLALLLPPHELEDARQRDRQHDNQKPPHDIFHHSCSPPFWSAASHTAAACPQITTRRSVMM